MLNSFRVNTNSPSLENISCHFRNQSKRSCIRVTDINYSLGKNLALEQVGICEDQVKSHLNIEYILTGLFH